MRTKRSNKTLFKFLYSYSKINFLSKSSQDSDMMQMQPNVGTLFRLGSDVHGQVTECDAKMRHCQNIS